jgi:hypothetical protein
VEREGARSGSLTRNTSYAELGEIPHRNTATTAADALRQSAFAASEPKGAQEDACPRRSANARPTIASRHCTPASRRASPTTRADRPKKNLPTLLVAEPAYVTTIGRRRKITKREAVIPQLVNESAGANLRATEMLIDMMKDIERKTEVEPPPEPHRFASRRSQGELRADAAQAQGAER